VGYQYPILHQLTMVPRVPETMGSCLGCLPPDTDANEATGKEGRKGKEGGKKEREKVQTKLPLDLAVLR